MKKLSTSILLMVLASVSYGQSVTNSAIEEGVIGFFSVVTLMLIIYGVQWVIKLFRGSAKDATTVSEQRKAYLRKMILTSSTALFAVYPFIAFVFLLNLWGNYPLEAEYWLMTSVAWIAFVIAAWLGERKGIYAEADKLFPLNKTKDASTQPDTKFYEQALAELDSGERNSGIWAKAYAEGADEEHSRKLYVKLRATQLMHEQTAY